MRLCSIEGCEKRHYAKGLCRQHYRKVHPEKKSTKPCIVEGCKLHQQARGYCSKHYFRLQRFSDVNHETQFDKNKYIENSDTIEIILKNARLEEVGRAVIDTDDKDRVLYYKWYLNQNGYVCNDVVGYLHSFVSGKDKKGVVVDHINNNKLDNRKENLRICSNGVNIQRAVSFKSNTSGYRGVCYVRRLDRWFASIKKDGIQYSLRYHKTKEDAAKAYNKKALELFGEYAWVNTIQ